MQLTYDIPDELLKNIHEQALEKLAQLDNVAYHVPMHTAKMKLLEYGIVETIIPPVSVRYNELTSKGVVSNRIEYRITYNYATFPLAHVYGGSGYLCLGSIYVPPFVSPYDLMRPLETLFLHNDRYVSHGGAECRLDSNQHKELHHFCQLHELDIRIPNDNLAKHDTIWIIGYQLLQKYTKENAFNYMEEAFKIIFR